MQRRSDTHQIPRQRALHRHHGQGKARPTQEKTKENMSDTFPAFQQKPAHKLNYSERAKAGLLVKKPRHPVSQKTRARIKPKSDKRKKDDVEYEKLKLEFFVLHPICQRGACYHPATGIRINACQQPATDIHHKARRGPFMLRADTWMSACRICHTLIEENQDWAREEGYLLTPQQRRELLHQ